MAVDSSSKRPPTAPRPELPVAERRRRRRELWISAAVLAAIVILLVLQRSVSGLGQAVSFRDSVLFVFLNALNVILIVLLVYLVARNFVKLVFERRRGILGSHLNFKFLMAFIVIATVPTSLLFFVSYSFIGNSVDTWFSLQVDHSLEESREVAEAYYDATAHNALFYGTQISEQIASERLLREDQLAKLEEFVERKQREYNLGVVEVFSATGEELVTAINPEIPLANFTRADSKLVRSGLAGSRSSLVEEAGSGDVIRGVVPISSSFRSGETVGVVVVNHFVPYSLARKVATIRETLADYRTLQPQAGSIRSLYQMELLLFALVILLFAIWWGFRMANGVTGPIRALAEGTAEVARGNLDVQVESQSDDEIGFLVKSFNRMTHDLREAHTHLEHSNSELDQRRRYMEVVLRNVGAGVVSLDAERRVSTINPSAQRLLGIAPGAPVLGRSLDEVVSHPDHLAVVRELRDKLQPGLRESIRRQVQVTVGEEVRTLLVTVTLLQDDDDQALGTVVVFDDYTQEVRAQRMAAWREVARRIAHEIKNPLTPIQLSAQRIRRRFADRFPESPDDAKVLDECVDTITSQVEGLKLLVDEFSNFARLPSAHPRSEDLNRLIQDAVASYSGTEGVLFRTHLDERLPRVELDQEQIRRLLTNLIDNSVAAIRAGGGDASTQVGGQIELRTAHHAPLQSVRLEVLDNGVGIPPKDRPHIFEPYFSTKSQGTGLGLAIVSRTVAEHRGHIRVHANKPQGTRFVVELPVRSA